jgi:phytoene synthase
MTVATSGQGNDELYCWEQVTKTNRLFRVSHVFAPPRVAEKLLALYALFSVIEQACTMHSDEEIARNKLRWWRLECIHRDLTHSHHPALKELVRTGAAPALDTQSLTRLLDRAEARLDLPAPADVEDLKARCQQLSQPQLEMEARICGIGEGELDWNPELSACSGLMQFIRESSGENSAGRYRWLPLSLRAKHGVNQDAVLRKPRSGPVVELFSEMMNIGIEWGTKCSGQREHRPATRSELRHLHVISGLHLRKLKRLKKLSPDRHPFELGRLGPGDLLAAWNSARRNT